MKNVSWNNVRIGFKPFVVQLETKNVSIFPLNYASVKGSSVICDGCLDTVHVA